MKLTPFGEKVRTLRIQLGLSLKAMAEAMQISSSHLSGIEYGEKRLSDKHSAAAIAFLKLRGAADDELVAVRHAAEASKDTLNTSGLTPDSRTLVAAFARRLQEGACPTPEIEAWLSNRKKANDQ